MLVERVDSLDELRPEWSSFAERRGGIFATWEWSRTWWRHYGSGRELLLHVSRSTDGQLLSVLPLYVWRPRWPRVIRFLGHGPGDELGPLHVPGGGSVAASALRAALDVLRWDVFAGEQLPGDEAWSNLLGAPTWRREACPALHVPAGGWDEYLASRSSNFREQLARRRRALEDGGALGFRLADETSLDRDLDTLFALHRARWGSRESDFADTPFHRELAHTALKRGWLRLWLLELDGLPLAAWHGFQVGEIASYYQAGRDPAYERLSVGFVLLAHSLREAIAEGASEYRFGRGGEGFKYRFTSEDPGVETVALARGPVGRAALACGRTVQYVRRLRRGRSCA